VREDAQERLPDGSQVATVGDVAQDEDGPAGRLVRVDLAGSGRAAVGALVEGVMVEGNGPHREPPVWLVPRSNRDVAGCVARSVLGGRDRVRAASLLGDLLEPGEKVVAVRHRLAGEHPIGGRVRQAQLAV
jgi:hypothetical protein